MEGIPGEQGDLVLRLLAEIDELLLQAHDLVKIAAVARIDATMPGRSSVRGRWIRRNSSSISAPSAASTGLTVMAPNCISPGLSTSILVR